MRFFMPLLLALCLVAYLLSPLTDGLFRHWAEADLRARSLLIFSSIEEDLPGVLDNGRAEQLAKRFTQMAQDERLIGIGYCEGPGLPKYRNNDFPADLQCLDTGNVKQKSFMQQTIKGGPVMIALFPVARAGGGGYLMVVHDMQFAQQRSEQTQRYILWFVFGISLLAALITMGIARLTFSRWVGGLRDYVRTGKRGRGLPRETVGLARDIQQRIRQMEREQQQRPLLSGPRWSASALSEFVRKNLPSEQLISVSCRQPYVHVQTENGIECTMPASGLVTAIEPIMQACHGTWIAVANSEADRLAADDDGALMVPPDNPSYRLKRLWLSEAEEAGFYAGFANEGLWPLCNMAYVKPRFREVDWAMYQQVNEKFADAIVAESKSDAPIIFVQDYHFGLLPKLIRERLPNALIIVFWHIPWPNSETFGIMPRHAEFLEGILAADIIGFHTQFHCNNFLDCVDTYVEALIDREHDTIRRGGDFCMVRPYPISIAWPDFEALNMPDIAACRAHLAELAGVDPAMKIILGVERLDYIKGIPERLRAFDMFLQKNPEWHGKVCFVQVASPSRSIIPAYGDIDREIEDTAAAINAQFGTKEWQPIHVLKRNFGQAEVYRFYRGADVGVVSSLHDGMNLVAKEFVAARDDERGVLILSQFAGSSRELVDALIVNPYDDGALAHSILRALTMNEDEQRARMASMREHVRAHNIFAWAAEILGDAANLHRRRQLKTMLGHMEAEAGEASSTPDAAEEQERLPWQTPSQKKYRN